MVCQLVSHTSEPCKTAQPIEMLFRFLARMSPRNHELEGVQILPWEGAILRGKGCPVWSIGTYCHELCKNAEVIDSPFGLGTPVGRRKHEFKHIRHVAPVCTSSVVFARWRQCALMGGHIGATWRIYDWTIRLLRRCSLMSYYIDHLLCYLMMCVLYCIVVFSALTLLVGHQEEHSACKWWEMSCWRGYLSEVRWKWFACGPADATATPSSPASLKSRMVLLFWCKLTQVFLEKRPLNGCLSAIYFFS